MNRADSTRKPTKSATAKPYKDFPLFKHRNGQWAKKVRGKLIYFGVDHKEALDLWLKQKDDLLAGRTPRDAKNGELTVKALCDLFCEYIDNRVKTGERSKRLFDDYQAACIDLANRLGRNTPVEALHPADFRRLRTELAKNVSLKTLEGRIVRVRAVFNYGVKNNLISVNLTRLWGIEFEKPEKSVIKGQSSKYKKMFTAAQIKSLLDACESPQVKAMLLLAANCGIGNTDVTSIEFDDIEGEWLTKIRQKTKKVRRIPLWPETQAAIQAAIDKRPQHKDPQDSERIFITKYGSSWIPTRGDDPLSKEFAKLRKEAKLKRGTFYWMRHTFQTIGDETKDFVGVSCLMGHVDYTTSGEYRETISDERLKAVVNHVRNWLFGSEVTR